MAKQEAKPWDQLDDESDLWHARFEIYRQLGSIRSVHETYRIAQKEDPERITGKAPGSGWHDAAKRFKWAERARAYDAAEREKFRKEEEELSNDKRRSRLQMIGELQAESFAAIKNANIADMDEVQARSFFPQLRLLLLGLLGAERAEFGGAPIEGNVDGADSFLSPEMQEQLLKAWGEAKVVGD